MIRFIISGSPPRCTTPSEAVAVILAQLVARDSQSRFSRRNWSDVVPQCMNPLAITVAVWQTEARTASLVCFRIIRKHLIQKLQLATT